jgi:DNA-binding transcriptional MerR regulator
MRTWVCSRRSVPGRNRIYTQRDRTRLKLTLRGKRLGLSLLEIKQLVDMYDSPVGHHAAAGGLHGRAGAHRRLLEQQREDIEITLAEIAPARSALPQPAGRRRRSPCEARRKALA